MHQHIKALERLKESAQDISDTRFGTLDELELHALIWAIEELKKN
jgi:hypothetical protein